MRNRTIAVASAGALLLTVLQFPSAVAQENQAPSGTLTAQLLPPETIYTANFTDPDGDPLTYAWSADISCGLFFPNHPEEEKAVWSHPSEHESPNGCPHEQGTDHPGSVSVRVSDGKMMVSCTFETSGGGEGACAPPEGISCGLNMRLFDGNFGALPSDDMEEERGAFTVFNGNDSDGSQSQDVGETRVRGERDLMRLILRRPEPNLGGLVTLEILSNPQKIRFFSAQSKVDELVPDPTLEFATSELPKVIWIEGIQKSDEVRDVGLRYSYLAGGDACEDFANATIVWAEPVEARHDWTDAVWPELTEPPRGAFTRQCDGFGLRPVMPAPKGIRNCIGFKFQVFPATIGFETDVKWDVTRQKESLQKVFYSDGDVNRVRSQFPEGEEANDDRHNNDESAMPVADLFFSFDGPGLADADAPRSARRIVYRAHFRDFMRVRFDGVRPKGNRRAGTGASLKVLWDASHTWRNRRGRWVRTTGNDDETKENKIATRLF